MSDRFPVIVALSIGILIGYWFFRPTQLKEEPKKAPVEYIGNRDTRYDFKHVPGPPLEDTQFSEDAEYVSLELEKNLKLENKLNLQRKHTYELRLELEKNLQLEHKLELERRLELLTDLELEKQLELEKKLYIEYIDVSRELNLDIDPDLYRFAIDGSK